MDLRSLDGLATVLRSRFSLIFILRGAQERRPILIALYAKHSSRHLLITWSTGPVYANAHAQSLLGAVTLIRSHRGKLPRPREILLLIALDHQLVHGDHIGAGQRLNWLHTQLTHGNSALVHPH